MAGSVFDPSVQDEDLESKIVFALDRLADTFRVLLWNENDRYRLSPLQSQFLIFLRFHGVEYRTITSLAREFNVSKPTASDSIRSLEQKGYVSRVRAEEDRRVNILTLTKRGEQVADAVSRFGSLVKLPISRLGTVQKTSFLKVLMRLLSEFHHSRIISPLRMCILCKNLEIEQRNGNPFYCSRRDRYLGDSDLRVDCVNHEYSGEQDENLYQFFP